jgi:hypothetical protein
MSPWLEEWRPRKTKINNGQLPLPVVVFATAHPEIPWAQMRGMRSSVSVLISERSASGALRD